MNSHIVLLNWRDTGHPASGGAERLTEDIAHYLHAQGHAITIVCALHEGAQKEEVRDGINYIRRGSHITVRLWAPWIWFTQLRYQSPTIVVDQIHWIPFLARLYIKSVPVIPFINEVAGDLWMRTPYSFIGRYLEYLGIRVYARSRWITISNSTKRELVDMGVLESRVSIIPPTVHTVAVKNVLLKQGIPTLLWLGRIVSHKQLSQALQAYIIAKKDIPKLRMVIAGVAQKKDIPWIQAFCAKQPGVSYRGEVSEQEKQTLLTDAWALVISSSKEGYGLTVLEAARRATPTLAYRVAGLEDAVIDTVTGLLCSPTPEDLARAIVTYIEKPAMVEAMQNAALKHSYAFSQTKTGQAIEEILQL